MRPLHILLVEDHGVTAKMMRMVLTEDGHTVAMAGDIATGLDLASQNSFDLLFSDLGLPKPHVHLGVGSGTHAEQTGMVMIAYEKLLMKIRPDLTVVAGDVNSTIAATLAAVKLGVKVAHLEAGLRSFDRSMPEEINRIATDALADYLWTPSPDGDQNLLREGVSARKIERVGNIMIDSLEMMRHRIEQQDGLDKYGLAPGGFGLVTLHRPSNVDSPENLSELCRVLIRVSEKIPLVFPVHPRTRKNLAGWGLLDGLREAPGIRLDEPVSYIPFMSFVFQCRLAITDSGGIQEDTTYLGKPCLTLRPNTERPVTVIQGTNRLCRIAELEELVMQTLREDKLSYRVPDLWDGRTAERIIGALRRLFAV